MFGFLTSMYSIYNPEEEYKRMQIPDKDWRLSFLNKNYELSPTYPNICAVPTNLSDAK